MQHVCLAIRETSTYKHLMTNALIAAQLAVKPLELYAKVHLRQLPKNLANVFKRETGTVLVSPLCPLVRNRSLNCQLALTAFKEGGRLISPSLLTSGSTGGGESLTLLVQPVDLENRPPSLMAVKLRLITSIVEACQETHAQSQPRCDHQSKLSICLYRDE